MSVQNRKLGFYTFIIKVYRKGRNEDPVYDKDFLIDFLNYVANLSKAERIIKFDTQKKAYALDSLSYQGQDIIKVIFNSCKYGHSPDLMSSDSGSVRNSNKRLNEGEEEKTHLCIKLDASEAKVILEERKSGLSITTIVNYLNKKIGVYYESLNRKRIYTIGYQVIPIDDFWEALDKMSEVKAAEIYIAKEAVGSEYFNNMVREDPFVQEEVILTVKAKKAQGLMHRTAINAYNWLMTSGANVSKIRIKGKDAESAPSLIDTELIKKKAFVDSLLNVNGTVNSEDILSKMVDIIKGL